MERQKPNNLKSKKVSKVTKTVKLSMTKTREIEKGFRITIDKSRDNYLSKELSKYKSIKVSYD
tara:strand:+ start:2959 stop:3147 length:189 start_codon:yes stop_codon:yes gene_type:complete